MAEACGPEPATIRRIPRAAPTPPFHPLPGVPSSMVAIALALVPLLFATGCLVWLMLMGAREQAKADAWAEEWARQHRGEDAH